MVPTDFSDFSRYGLDYAITIVRSFGAKITLIHITHERELDALRQVSAYFELEKLEELLKQRVAKDRKQLVTFILPELR